jgi:aryl-alcohol dehydrogenase-like predicted oxidoreductase
MVPRTTLGASGIEAGRLGLAGSYGVSADDTERAFHELGVSYFFVTGRTKGLAEGIRRLVKAGHRDRMVIAAGAGLPTGGGVERAHAKMARSLGVEVIDVFHLFWVQAHWYVTGKTWPAMEKLKRDGKARALAVSIHDRKMARQLVDELSLDVLMIRYNAAHRGAEGEIFATLGERRPGIVAYTATRWGKLLEPLGELPAMTAPECYRFALGHPKVDLVLCGARSYGELAQAAEGVASGPLPEARLAEVRQFGDQVRARAGAAARISFG